VLAVFPEPVNFLKIHHAAQNTTQQNVTSFAKGTNYFAKAAGQISADYRGSDAFSHARVRDGTRRSTSSAGSRG
jgi:hypothetical protein